MPIQDVPVSMTVQKITFDSDVELFELRQTLKSAGWVGGLQNSRNLDGTANPDDKVQMTSPDGQVLLYDKTTTIARVNGIYAAMTAEEYQDRYGAST